MNTMTKDKLPVHINRKRKQHNRPTQIWPSMIKCCLQVFFDALTVLRARPRTAVYSLIGCRQWLRDSLWRWRSKSSVMRSLMSPEKDEDDEDDEDEDDDEDDDDARRIERAFCSSARAQRLSRPP